MPKFSETLKPLFILTSKNNNSFDWKENHEAVRKEIILALTRSPVLTIFDPQYPVELHTDASSVAYGAILMQGIIHIFWKPWQYLTQ